MNRLQKILFLLRTKEMVVPADPHIACRTTIRSLEQQRDTAFGMNERLQQALVRLSGEVVRLSQRATPVIPEGEVDQPKSTRESDEIASVTLNDPERLRRPAPGPARVDG